MNPKLKRNKSTPGYSFVALMKRALRDGLVHSTTEIAAFVRRQIGHTGPPMTFEKGTIIPLLPTRKCFEPVSTIGYRLSAGITGNNAALDVLLQVRRPMTLKEISLTVIRQNSGLPESLAAVEELPISDYDLVPDLNFDLDNDGRFIDYHDQGQLYWYPNQLLSINDFVRDLITRYGPIKETELYELLLRDYRIAELASIFLPDLDPYLMRKGRRFVVVSESQEEIIMLTREDYDPVLYFLWDEARPYPVWALAKYFFNKPATQTDLEAVLLRQSGIVKNAAMFRGEPPTKLAVLDEKKLSAATKKAVDLIQTSNIPLPPHLLVNSIFSDPVEDVASVYANLLISIKGFLPVIREKLGIRTITEEEQSIFAEDHTMPRLLTPQLCPEVARRDETAFIDKYLARLVKEEPETKVEPEIAGNPMRVRHILPYNEYCTGNLVIDEAFSKILPDNPLPTALFAVDYDRNLGFEVIVDSAANLVRGFRDYFHQCCPPSGAIIYLGRCPDEPFTLTISFKINEVDPLSVLSAAKINSLQVVVDQAHHENLTAFEILWLLFVARDTSEPIHRNTLWAEINVVRRVTRRAVSTILEAYTCFLQRPNDVGFGLFMLDPTIMPALKP